MSEQHDTASAGKAMLAIIGRSSGMILGFLLLYCGVKIFAVPLTVYSLAEGREVMAPALLLYIYCEVGAIGGGCAAIFMAVRRNSVDDAPKDRRKFDDADY